MDAKFAIGYLEQRLSFLLTQLIRERVNLSIKVIVQNSPTAQALITREFNEFHEVLPDVLEFDFKESIEIKDGVRLRVANVTITEVKSFKRSNDDGRAN